MANVTTTKEETAFDTLTTAKNLQQAGFDRGQAEALAMVLALSRRDLATKEDLANLELRLRAEMANLESRLESKIGALRTIMLGVFLPIQLMTLTFIAMPYFGG